MVGVIVGVLAALPASARADDASPWDADARAGMRLIAASPTRAMDNAIRAGIEVKLAPGWKTYWRYPGDSGVPPRFDFAGSQNVKSVAVEWPAPHRFSDDGETTIGYKGNVIFPLRVEPQDAAKPVELHVVLDYAVCEKLCVPAQGRAVLALAAGGSSHDSALAAAEATVPRRAKLGDDAPLAVRTVHRETADGHPRIVVDVAAPDAPIDLFAEGPTADWALPVPAPADGAPPGLHRFVFALDGVPPGASTAGAVLTLTLTSGGKAIEVAAPLD